jgi:uridylate kinase
MEQKRTILLKLTGDIFTSEQDTQLHDEHTRMLAQQLQQLSARYRFGIVIGGGNFFRGSKEGKQLGLTPSVGHQIGMLATMMNGLILKDLLEQEGVPASLFSAVPSPEIGIPISAQTIQSALARNHCLIFAGGTGNPFFTTDTTAVLRALQINASEIWKGTGVDGIYDEDPKKNPAAHFLKKVSYTEALINNFGIMDATAFALANDHKLTIRVFNIFHKNAIITAAEDETFGSKVTHELT